MLKISFLSLGSPIRWFDCKFDGIKLTYQLPDSIELNLSPDEPLILDVRFCDKHGVTTRDLDHAIPRWANASDWNKARATVTGLKEMGYIK